MILWQGPFAGALEQAERKRCFFRECFQVSVLDGEEDQSIRDEIGRLVPLS